MKLTISQDGLADANKAKIPNTLLKRIQDIVDDPNESEFEKNTARECLRFLKRLKRMDEAAKARISPDKNGWYNAFYVKPEENETVEVEYEEKVYQADFDGTFWWPNDGNMEPKVGIKKWRLIK